MSNNLLSAKKTKRARRKLISHLELFQQVQFLNFYIYMTCRLQKPRNHCERPWFTYAYTSQGVKHLLFYSKYRIEVGKLKCFKIQ